MGNSISLEEELINLKITSKQMQRAAKKCESNEKAAVNKLKKVGSSGIVDFCSLNPSSSRLVLQSFDMRSVLLFNFFELVSCRSFTCNTENV